MENLIIIARELLERRPDEGHYSDVIMSAMASQITGVPVVCWTVCWGADQREHQSSTSLAFLRGIHRWPVDSSDKGPVTRKMFPFDDVIFDKVALSETYNMNIHLYVIYLCCYFFAVDSVSVYEHAHRNKRLHTYNMCQYKLAKPVLPFRVILYEIDTFQHTVCVPKWASKYIRLWWNAQYVAHL